MITVQFPPDFDQAFRDTVMAQIGKVAPPVESAMAQEFYDITQQNFGKFGVARTIPWVALSPAYAKRVKRSYATLEVTGRLAESVRLDGNTVSVSDDEVPYALIHQFGGVKQPMPQRPYFPIENSSPDDQETILNPIAEDRIGHVAAAQFETELNAIAATM